MELDNRPDGVTNHRNAMFIKENILYKREVKYEAKDSSNICIKIGYKGMRKFFVNGFYKQWHILYNDDILRKQSGTNVQMNRRFEDQTNLWEEMLIDNPGTEAIIAGDFNIDNKFILREENDNSNSAIKHSKTKKMIRMKLVNTNPTRFENGVERGLDHFYTNRIDKLYQLNQDDQTPSDHSMLDYIRHMKIESAEEKFVMTRKWNLIDYEAINQNIIENEHYQVALNDNDSNRIADYIVNQINANLDLYSEMKRMKVKTREDHKYSANTIVYIY